MVSQSRSVAVGGEDTSAVTTTLNGALLNDTAGTGGSGTSITLTDASQFPSSGTNFIQVGTEEISYTGVSGNNLTGITRAVRNSTRAAHSCLKYIVDLLYFKQEW